MQANLAEFTILTAINGATAELTNSSSSPRLDAEILLAHTLGVVRSYLLAWPERPLLLAQQQGFTTYINRRAQGEPLAYIIGSQEFWSLDFTVTPATLVPRADSELLIEIILTTLPAAASLQIADLGTGAGPLALALASARPAWHVHATDNNADTLAVAKLNAQRLKISNVSFHLGFWYDALPNEKFAAIISNPPYVAINDKDLAPAVARYEPHAALFGGVDGLSDLRHIITHANNYLQPQGLLIVEHGVRQAGAVTDLFKAAGFEKIVTHQDLSGNDRATLGVK
ncbi:MAG: peptide chain release factor N(5)-glutamine methyltransferase [Pseudomonadota bacterium]